MSRFLAQPEIVDAVRAACERAVEAGDYKIDPRLSGSVCMHLILDDFVCSATIGWLMAHEDIDRVLTMLFDAAIAALRDARDGALIPRVSDLATINEWRLMRGDLPLGSGPQVKGEQP